LSERLRGEPVWALKPASAKRLLTNNPPKRLMKQLGYRSVGSMLKREDILMLFLVLERLESARYLKVFYGACSKLSAADFEARKPQIVSLPYRRWGPLAKKAPLLSVNYLVGAVAVWPNEAASRARTLSLAILGRQAVEKLHCRGLALKFKRLQADYGEHLNKPKAELSVAAHLVGQPIAWRTICSHYGRQSSAGQHQLLNEYNLEAEDLCPHHSKEPLAGLHPALKWWAGNDHLIFLGRDGKTASLNLVDAAVNQAAEATFGKRSLAHARYKLWDELISRYLAYPAVADEVHGQLEGQPAQVPDKIQLLFGYNYSQGLIRLKSG
jgi:hypothetical protein